MTDDDDFIIYLERSSNKWPLMPENYSFFIMDEGEPQFFRLKRDFIRYKQKGRGLPNETAPPVLPNTEKPPR